MSSTNVCGTPAPPPVCVQGGCATLRGPARISAALRRISRGEMVLSTPRGRIHYGWIVVAVTFVTLLAAAGIRSAPGVLMIPLEREFGWTRATVSFAVSINLFLYGLSGPFVAGLMDRRGIRRVMVVSLALVAAGLALGLRSRDFWLLAGSFFICGLSTNGLIGTHLIPASMEHGLPEVTAASLLALIGVLDIIGTTVSGWLSDRWDNRYLLCWYYGLRGLSLLFLPYAFGSAYLGLAAFVIFYGLDCVATVPPTARLAADTLGRGNVGIMFGWIAASQPIGPGIRVVAPGGRRVERGPARASGRSVSVAMDATEPGTYVVTWRVVSGDAQPERGRFAFSVSRPTASLAAVADERGTAAGSGFVLAVLGRALHFLGYALGFGSLAFRWLVVRPLGVPQVAALDRALWRLTRSGAAALVLAEPLVGLGHALRLGVTGDAGVLADVLESRVGLVIGQRLGIALALGAVLP